MPFHIKGPNVNVRTDATEQVAPVARRMVGLNCTPTNPAHLAGVKKLGVTRIRSTLYWTNWPDGSPGEIVAAANDAQLDLLMVVHMPPQKYINDRVNGTPVLAALIAERAAAWPGISWQIMNEMDGNDGFNGGWYKASDSSVTQLQRGQWYGELLAVCGDAIKKADQSAKVVGGGIALEPADFVRGILATCPRSSFDALAVHAYGQPDIGQFSSKSQAVKAVDATIPLWCTEFGSRLADPVAQAAEIEEVFHDNDANQRYDRTYLYALEDQTEGYGIMLPDGTFRDAHQQFAQRTAL